MPTLTPEQCDFPTYAIGVIRSILSDSEIHGQPLHPAVRERLGRIDLLGPTFFASISDRPSDLSDLRLRRTTDQREQLLANLANWKSPLSPEIVHFLRVADRDDGLTVLARTRLPDPGVAFDRVIKLGVAEPDRLHQLAACYVDALSAWGVVSQWAVALEPHIAAIASSTKGAGLLLALGTTRAAIGHVDYGEYFAPAVAALDDPWDRFFGSLRWTTAAVKRGGAADAVRQCFASTGAIAETLADEGADDRLFAHALLCNLRALHLIKQGSFMEASVEMRHAADTIGELVPDLRPDIVGRYRVTIAVNRAVLAAKAEGAAVAAEMLKGLVTKPEVRDDTTNGSLAEVLGLTALFLMRAGRVTHSEPVARRALACSAARGGTTQLRELCRMMVLIRDEAEDFEGAMKWLHASALPDPRDAPILGSLPDAEASQR